MTQKSPTEVAARAWLENPLMIAARPIIEKGGVRAMLESLLIATFVEGAVYATKRCKDDGHGEKP